MSITETRSGRIWIGTFGGGANAIDPATGLIRQLPLGDQPGAVSSAEVTAIAEDWRGNLWIGTMGGLNLASADGRVRKVFRNQPNDAASLPANSIYAIAIDAQDRVAFCCRSRCRRPIWRRGIFRIALAPSSQR